jgi:hypothetical protein
VNIGPIKEDHIMGETKFYRVLVSKHSGFSDIDLNYVAEELYAEDADGNEILDENGKPKVIGIEIDTPELNVQIASRVTAKSFYSLRWYTVEGEEGVHKYETRFSLDGWHRTPEAAWAAHHEKVALRIAKLERDVQNLREYQKNGRQIAAAGLIEA